MRRNRHRDAPLAPKPTPGLHGGEDTYHLDVQFASEVVNRGQRFEEGKHERLGAGPAADQQADFDPPFVRHPPQLGVNVCPVPAGGAARINNRTAAGVCLLITSK